MDPSFLQEKLPLPASQIFWRKIATFYEKATQKEKKGILSDVHSPAFHSVEIAEIYSHNFFAKIP